MRKSTKDRIVEAAIDLFNESGVSAVTTNHIATHLGISPGNLYYHFANKEEIVREAFERMNAEADAVWKIDPREAEVDKFLLQRIVIRNLQLYTRYIFFARELTSLLHEDPVLRERYASVSARRMDQLIEVLRPLVKAGILKNIDDDDDLRALAEIAWMIGLFCVPYAEATMVGVTGRSAKARDARIRAALERGAILVLNLFKPYLDELGYTALVVLVRSELEKAQQSL